MITLTDRYIATTVRHIPEKQREDIERELRAAIADDVDARVAHGQTLTDAEYAALRELGDPTRLATRYAQRPAVLIGPSSYPDYVKAVRSACTTLLPILYIVLLLVRRAHGDNVWETIFRPLGATLNVAMYLIVALTALFAAVDRALAVRPDAIDQAWTPDQLTAEQPPRPHTWRDLAGWIIRVVVLVAALLIQRVLSPVSTPDGHAVAIVNPGLWKFWIPYFVAVMVLGVALAAVNLRLDRRQYGTAIGGTVLLAAGLLPLGWLFWQAQVINRALTHGTGVLATAGNWTAWLADIVLALCALAYLRATWRTRRPGLR